MRLESKIAFNTIIQIINKLSSNFLGLIIAFLITRYLGPEGFGKYTTIITFLSFFTILFDFGLTLVTSQMLSEKKFELTKTLNNLFSFRLFSILFAVLLACFLVFLFPYEESIKIGVIFLSGAFVFIGLNQVLIGFFQKELETEKFAIAEFCGKVFLLLGVLFAIKFDFSLGGIIIATVFANFLNFGIAFLFLYRKVKIRIEYDRTIWQAIFQKSWPLAITIGLNLIYLKSDTLILSLMKTQHDVGLYGAAYKVIDILITIPFSFAGILLPIFTQKFIIGDISSFKNIFKYSLNLMIMIAIPMVFVTQILSFKLIVLIAGEEFIMAGNILNILIFACAIIFLNCIFSHIIIAIDKQKEIIKAYIFTAISSFFLYLFLIDKYSYIGAAWGTVYSELVITLFAIYYVYKYISLKIDWVVVLKVLFLSCFLCFLIKDLLIREFSLFFIFLIMFFVYFIGVYFFGIISKKEIKKVFNN